MSEVRDIPLTVNLTKTEGEALYELWERYDMSYDELVGKALKVYCGLENLIDKYELNKE